MSEKVKLTQEQANAFDDFKRKKGTIEAFVNNKGSYRANYKSLNTLAVEDFARAYLIGYDVEQDVVKIKDLLHDYCEILNLQSVQYKGTYRIPDRFNKYDTIAVVSCCEHAHKNLYVIEISIGKGFQDTLQYELDSLPKNWVLLDGYNQ